jgi:hypothetical protein
VSRHSFNANTQMAPPGGTFGTSPGKKGLTAFVIARASPSQPDCTARYFFPSTVNVVGGAMMPELVVNSHRILPLTASNANVPIDGAAEHRWVHH